MIVCARAFVLARINTQNIYINNNKNGSIGSSGGRGGGSREVFPERCRANKLMALIKFCMVPLLVLRFVLFCYPFDGDLSWYLRLLCVCTSSRIHPARSLSPSRSRGSRFSLFCDSEQVHSLYSFHLYEGSKKWPKINAM